MRKGWKTRIEERKYFEERIEERLARQSALEYFEKRMQLELQQRLAEMKANHEIN